MSYSDCLFLESVFRMFSKRYFQSFFKKPALWGFLCLTGIFIGCYIMQQPIKPLNVTVAIWNGGMKNSVFKRHPTLIALKKEIERLGHTINTHDITPVTESDLILVARPNYRLPDNAKAPAFLWLLETPITIRVAPDQNLMNRYDKIFTYKRDLVDNKKYFYMPIPYDYSKVLSPFPTLADKKILVAQIATNHSHGSSLENYSERRRATDYFIKNAPQDFNLYGSGWPRFKKTLSENDQKAFDLVYKGWAKDKIQTVRTAKFILAYENAKFPGYVSEKIFDAMAGGAVPIYSGAPDIYDYVPKNCLINRDDFSSYQELYTFLKHMSDETYNTYLKCIHDFMSLPTHYNDTETTAAIFEQEIIRPYLHKHSSN